MDTDMGITMTKRQCGVLLVVPNLTTKRAIKKVLTICLERQEYNICLPEKACILWNTGDYHRMSTFFGLDIQKRISNCEDNIVCGLHKGLIDCNSSLSRLVEVLIDTRQSFTWKNCPSNRVWGNIFLVLDPLLHDLRNAIFSNSQDVLRIMNMIRQEASEIIVSKKILRIFDDVLNCINNFMGEESARTVMRSDLSSMNEELSYTIMHGYLADINSIFGMATLQSTPDLQSKWESSVKTIVAEFQWCAKFTENIIVQWPNTEKTTLEIQLASKLKDICYTMYDKGYHQRLEGLRERVIDLQAVLPNDNIHNQFRYIADESAKAVSCIREAITNYDIFKTPSSEAGKIRIDLQKCIALLAGPRERGGQWLLTRWEFFNVF
jgi:hypothetical protein